MRLTPVPGARASRAGLDLDADIEAGIAGTRARNEAELLGLVAPTLDNNPRFVDPGFNLTPDQQRNLAANQPDTAAVMELQQALAREEAERFSDANRVGYGPGGYYNNNGELVVEITRGQPWLPSGAASTNASALGISDEAVDAAIAAGETSVWDAAGYAARVTGYEVWNFLTAGFVKRHDARLTAEANGQLSTANLWRATALDAVGSVGSLYLGGRASTYAFNRLGAGYAGYMGSGAAGGAVFDLAHQGTQLGINALTGGQTGQEQFSLNELALATSSGALFGGAIRLGSGYNVRSPIYFDLEPAAAYSGVPLALRNPFVAINDAASAARIIGSRFSGDPFAYGGGPRPERVDMLLGEAAQASRIADLRTLVDEVQYVQGSSYFTVDSGQRILAIGSQAFTKSSAGQLIEAAHEIGHAQVFAKLVRQRGFEAAQAEYFSEVRSFGTRLYAHEEQVVERLARWRVRQYLGGLSPQQEAASTRYIEGWRNVERYGN